MLTEADIRAIAEVARAHDLIVISDEPYEAIIYDGQKSFSMGSIPGMEDLVITVNSFSKSYAMTGWRIGYVVAPKAVRERMTLLQESMGSSVTAMCQKAAVEAITGSQDTVDAMCREYEKRRNLLVEGLNQVQGFLRASNRAAHSMHSRISKASVFHHRNWLSISSTKFRPWQHREVLSAKAAKDI